MKTAKKNFVLIIACICIIGFNNCKRCKGEDPRARIVNNGTSTADVQIKTSGGSTININGVNKGATSEFKSFAPGEATFTINIDKNTVVKIVQMDECFEYDISIDANNNVVSIPKDRNE